MNVPQAVYGLSENVCKIVSICICVLEEEAHSFHQILRESVTKKYSHSSVYSNCHHRFIECTLYCSRFSAEQNRQSHALFCHSVQHM